MPAINSGLVTLPIAAGVKETSAGTVTLDCSDDASAAAADEVDMTATPVSALIG